MIRLQFASVIDRSTRLARLVRNLDVRLPTRSRYEIDARQEETVLALCKLDALSSLSVSPSTLDGSPPEGHVGYDIAILTHLEKLFGALLRGPQLQHLSLTDMSPFPGRLIIHTAQLQVLGLMTGSITRDEGEA